MARSEAWAKAGWTLFIIVLLLVGALVYQITRPKDLPYDRSLGRHDRG